MAAARISGAAERAFQRLLALYDRTLLVAPLPRCDHQAAAVVLSMTVWLFVAAPKTSSDQDTDQIASRRCGTGHVSEAGGVRGRVAGSSRAVGRGRLVSTISSAAPQTLGGPNLGQLVVHLKRAEAEYSATGSSIACARNS